MVRSGLLPLLRCWIECTPAKRAAFIAMNDMKILSEVELELSALKIR